MLFCDGHVAWYLQEDLIVGEPRTEADKPRIRMWNNDHLAPGDNPVPFVPPHPPPRP